MMATLKLSVIQARCKMLFTVLWSRHILPNFWVIAPNKYKAWLWWVKDKSEFSGQTDLSSYLYSNLSICECGWPILLLRAISQVYNYDLITALGARDWQCKRKQLCSPRVYILQPYERPHYCCCFHILLKFSLWNIHSS